MLGQQDALLTSADMLKHLHVWSSLIALALDKAHQGWLSFSCMANDIKLTLSRRSRVACVSTSGVATASFSTSRASSGCPLPARAMHLW